MRTVEINSKKVKLKIIMLIMKNKIPLHLRFALKRIYARSVAYSFLNIEISIDVKFPFRKYLTDVKVLDF